MKHFLKKGGSWKLNEDVEIYSNNLVGSIPNSKKLSTRFTILDHINEGKLIPLIIYMSALSTSIVIRCTPISLLDVPTGPSAYSGSKNNRIHRWQYSSTIH